MDRQYALATTDSPMESSKSSDDATRDTGVGERSYSKETSSEYSESPKSFEGGLGGGLALPVSAARLSLALLASGHGRAEGGEVKNKEMASDKE
jgi:hypothetical protein